MAALISAAVVVFASCPADAAPSGAAAASTAVSVGSKPKTSKTKSSGRKKTVKNTFATPDFAYPQEVRANADKALAKAMADGDYATALTALLQLQTVDLLRLSDAANVSAKRTDSVAKLMPEPYAAVARLLEAGVYTRQYANDRWEYDSRNVPLQDASESCLEWSRDVFIDRVTSLCGDAWAAIASIGSEPLTRLGSAVTVRDTEAVDKVSDFTIRDFAAVRIADMLGEFAGRSGEEVDAEDTGVIPFFDRKCAPAPVSPLARCVTLRRDVAKEWLDGCASRPGSYAQILAIREYVSVLPAAKRYESLLRLYDGIKDSPNSLFLLSDLSDAMNRLPQQGEISDDERGIRCDKDMFRLCCEALERHPKSLAANDAKNILDRVKRRSCSADLPAAALPGEDVMATAKARNVNECRYVLISLPDGFDDSVSGMYIVKNGKVARQVDFRFEGTVPFMAKDTVSLGKLTVGRYVLLPSDNGTLAGAVGGDERRRDYEVMRVGGITVVTAGAGTDRLFVVEGTNQKPIQGAEVTFYKRDYRVSRTDGLVKISSAVTDADGMAKVPDGTRHVRVKSGLGYYSCDPYAAKYSVRPDTASYAKILTDRAIYRPGDEVKFAVVTYSKRDRQLAALPATDVKVTLRDSSGESLDTLSLITDAFGRVEGSFLLPKGRLLGNWSLMAERADSRRFNVNYAGIRVEEYKLPTFHVVFETPEDEVRPGGTLNLKGKAMTYSGMPVAGAKAEVTVETFHPYGWWWRETSDGKCSTELTTASDGTFIVSLDSERLEGTPYAGSNFRVTAAVTDMAGETREATPYTFGFANGFTVRPDIPDKVEVSGDSVLLNVPVYDALGTPVVKKVECTVFNLDTRRSEKVTFTSPRLEMASASLPSGNYRLDFTVEGNMAQRPDTIRTIFFRADDAMAPEGQVAWVPVNRVETSASTGTVPVKVGSGFAGSWLFVAITDADGRIETRWVESNGENVTLDVPVPAANSRKRVSVGGMHNLVWREAGIDIIPAPQAEKLEVKTESFRSAVTAGDRETWRFSYTLGGRQVPAAVMAVMSDAALNALAPFRWSFNTENIIQWNCYAHLNAFLNGGTATYSKWFGYGKWLPTESIYAPDFTTWNVMVENLSRVYTTSRALGGAVLYEGVVDQVANEDAVPDAVPMARKMKSVVVGSGSESKAEYESADEEAVTGSVDSGSGTDETVDFRPGELPVAFFMPGLKTDADGNLDITFEVPNYNTTWQFQLMGYTPEMKTSTLLLETTASKKVMARLNAPRFLRTGDRVVLAGTLFNNTPDKAGISGEIQVLTADGRMLRSKNFGSENVDPAGSRMVEMEFDVPADVMQAVVRIYAKGSGHSDGEETVLEVVPSSTPVAESTPFWLSPGQQTFEMKLPDFKKNATLTLSYCDNPAWTCLTALPELVNPDSENVLAVAGALYGYSIGYNLVSRSDNFRKALASLFEKPEGDCGLLISNLEKDSVDKTVALPATPWLNDARGETARMSRLSGLLDDETAQKGIRDLYVRIAKQQNADGSWSWCPGMKGSAWITGMTLMHLGMLNSMGYLPNDRNVRDMVKKAVAYVDREYAGDYRRAMEKGVNQPFSTTAMNNWLYIRHLCGEKDLTKGSGKGFGELARKALAAIKEQWRGMDIYEKATAAMTLNAAGCGEVSRDILVSLSQTALCSPEKGMWFDTLKSGWSGWPVLVTVAQVLEAYTAVNPDAPEIDRLRQWLVLQRQVQDWGQDRYTAEVVHAILTSGTDWTQQPSAAPVISLGGKTLQIPDGEALTGAFTINVNVSDASGKTLSVERQGNGPAWGGVLSQYVAPVTDVKAQAIDPLSVTKEIALLEVADNRTLARAADNLERGQLVRVNITVVTDRDMDYVLLTDERAACMEPVEQLSRYELVDGVWCYRETRNTRTNLFFDFLPKGTHVFSYDCRLSQAGDYAAGISAVQSQYAPLITAHSAGKLLKVGVKKSK